MAGKPLEKARAQIAAVQAEIARHEQALPPLELLREQAQHSLESMGAPWQEFKARIASTLANGQSAHHTDLVHDHRPEALAALAFGMALELAGGAVAIVEAASDEAERLGAGDALRLTREEMRARLAALREELYGLELEEEAITAETGAPRRVGANAAAVLGIPADVARGLGLFNRGAQ